MRDFDYAGSKVVSRLDFLAGIDRLLLSGNLDHAQHRHRRPNRLDDRSSVASGIALQRAMQKSVIFIDRVIPLRK